MYFDLGLFRVLHGVSKSGRAKWVRYGDGSMVAYNSLKASLCILERIDPTWTQYERWPTSAGLTSRLVLTFISILSTRWSEPDAAVIRRRANKTNLHPWYSAHSDLLWLYTVRPLGFFLLELWDWCQEIFFHFLWNRTFASSCVHASLRLRFTKC